MTQRAESVSEISPDFIEEAEVARITAVFLVTLHAAKLQPRLTLRIRWAEAAAFEVFGPALDMKSELLSHVGFDAETPEQTGKQHAKKRHTLRPLQPGVECESHGGHQPFPSICLFV